jgi:hypothetical protein
VVAGRLRGQSFSETAGGGIPSSLKAFTSRHLCVELSRASGQRHSRENSIRRRPTVLALPAALRLFGPFHPGLRSSKRGAELHSLRQDSSRSNAPVLGDRSGLIAAYSTHDEDLSRIADYKSQSVRATLRINKAMDAIGGTRDDPTVVNHQCCGCNQRDRCGVAA